MEKRPIAWLFFTFSSIGLYFLSILGARGARARTIPLFPSKTYSQSHQDGIIDSIFNIIGTTNKYCIEFGFNSQSYTGGSGANTANLVLTHGWSHLLLDGYNFNSSLNLHRHWLCASNIIDLFRTHKAPFNPDYISVDIDSFDLWLFRSVIRDHNYRPRLISVEYNANYPLGVSITAPDWAACETSSWIAGSPGNMRCCYGASLSALNDVAESSGYSLIAVVKGLDAFFVRNDVLRRLNLDAPKVETFSNATCIPTHSPNVADQKTVDGMWNYRTYMKTGNRTAALLAAKSAIRFSERKCGFQIISDSIT